MKRKRSPSQNDIGQQPPEKMQKLNDGSASEKTYTPYRPVKSLRSDLPVREEQWREIQYIKTNWGDPEKQGIDRVTLNKLDAITEIAPDWDKYLEREFLLDALNSARIKQKINASIKAGKTNVLNISFNKLTRLPASLLTEKVLERFWRNLKKLELIKNNLTQLPKEIDILCNLEAIWLNHNQLSELPETINELSHLSVICVNDNKLSELPETMADLCYLKNIFLQDNQLTEIPETIGKLNKLEMIWLDNNQLSELPNSLIEKFGNDWAESILKNQTQPRLQSTPRP